MSKKKSKGCDGKKDATKARWVKPVLKKYLLNFLEYPRVEASSCYPGGVPGQSKYY